MACVLWLALVQQLVTGQAGPAQPADWWVTACFFQCDGPRTGDRETVGENWWSGLVKRVCERAVEWIYPTPEQINLRMEQLLFQSEDLREIHDEMRRFWTDYPSHVTPEQAGPTPCDGGWWSGLFKKVVKKQPITEPNACAEQLLFQSEDIGPINMDLRRPGMNDQPGHMTYQRVHGGMGP
jgi:hypothetical protein